jgi:DNA-binding transcriptional LysR family regulator
MGFDSRISLQKLEVFTAVVEHGGVSRAAEHLYVSQPVVSAHIRSLEERLGVTLFYREGRRLHLTEQGTAAHVWATEVLTRTRELSRQLESLSDGKHGTVVVGAGMSTGSYVLPSVLSRFKRERPGAKVSLYVSESDHVLQATELGECDLALVILEGPLETTSLHGELLREEELVLVAGADSSYPDVMCAADLADLPFVESPSGLVRRSIVDRRLQAIGIERRNVVIELGHPEAMKRATLEGLGVTMLFRSTVGDELAAGRLREIALSDVTLAVPLHLVYRKRKRLSQLQQELMEVIRETVR